MRIGAMLVGMGLFLGLGRADGLSPEAVGMRLGVSATSVEDLYTDLEAVVRWPIVWEGDVGRGWWLGFRLEASAGWLQARGDHGFIGTLGPVLLGMHQELPLRLEGGLSPAFMDRYLFGEDNFGSYVQFSSRVSLMWEFGEHWSAGYQFQHLSNGGFHSPNPGLNLHGFTALFKF